jgi:hypothetical protein
VDDWKRTGDYLKATKKRRPMAAIAPTMERCEGCDQDVTRGTLKNVLLDTSHVIGHRNGVPVYHPDGYKVLCSSCQRKEAL